MTASCAGCGGEAKGYAKVGDDRYCHGDANDAYPSCYERAQWRLSTPFDVDADARANYAELMGFNLPIEERRAAARTREEAAPTREG